jgi:hypothetical protein
MSLAAGLIGLLVIAFPIRAESSSGHGGQDPDLRRALVSLRAQIEQLRATIEKCPTLGCSNATAATVIIADDGMGGSGSMPSGGGMQGGGSMKPEHQMGGMGSSPVPSAMPPAHAPAGQQNPGMEQHMDEMHRHMDQMHGGGTGAGQPSPAMPPANTAPPAAMDHM